METNFREFITLPTNDRILVNMDSVNKITERWVLKPTEKDPHREEKEDGVALHLKNGETINVFEDFDDLSERLHGFEYYTEGKNETRCCKIIKVLNKNEVMILSDHARLSVVSMDRIKKF